MYFLPKLLSNFKQVKITNFSIAVTIDAGVESNQYEWLLLWTLIVTRLSEMVAAMETYNSDNKGGKLLLRMFTLTMPNEDGHCNGYSQYQRLMR